MVVEGDEREPQCQEKEVGSSCSKVHCIGINLWGGSKCLTADSRKKKNTAFYGVNLPIKADFKLLTWHHWMHRTEYHEPLYLLIPSHP